jgi:hypothetical protein
MLSKLIRTKNHTKNKASTKFLPFKGGDYLNTESFKIWCQHSSFLHFLQFLMQLFLLSL